MKSQRVAFLDYVRIVACFLVIMIHAVGSFVVHLPDEKWIMLTEENRFWVSFFDGFLPRIAVPLFIIVSAYLLVPIRKGMSMQEFYKVSG